MNAIRRHLLALALVSIAGYAAPWGAGAQDTITPPIPLGNTHPVLTAPYADTIYAVNISVDIDATGKADLTTLQLTGSAAATNAEAIKAWLRATTFRPGKKNGVPIRSRFRMSAEALKQVESTSP